MLGVECVDNILFGSECAAGRGGAGRGWWWMQVGMGAWWGSGASRRQVFKRRPQARSAA